MPRICWRMRSLLVAGKRLPSPRAFGVPLSSVRPLGGPRARNTRGAATMALSYLSAEEVRAILEGCATLARREMRAHCALVCQVQSETSHCRAPVASLGVCQS